MEKAAFILICSSILVVTLCRCAGNTERPGDDNGALRESIVSIASPFVDPQGREGSVVGMAIGVVTPNQEITIGLGATELGGDIVPDGETIFEIGSITKIFTGLLLADEVIAGRRQSTETIDHLLPVGVRAPSIEGRAITLLDLVTHTSGLPNWADNMSPPPNPGAGYTPVLLYDFLDRVQLGSVPGDTFVYSNLGAGLVGHLLGLSIGRDYDALVRERITGPLGMTRTGITVSGTQMARGYRTSRAVAPIRIDTLEGGGALRSTASDMNKLLAAALDLRTTPLAPALTLWRTPQRPTPRGEIGYLLAISDEEGTKIHEKGGTTGGFNATIMFIREEQVGVIVLTNNGEFKSDELAREILEASRSSLGSR